jgi:hypothetical protein
MGKPPLMRLLRIELLAAPEATPSIQAIALASPVLVMDRIASGVISIKDVTWFDTDENGSDTTKRAITRAMYCALPPR